MRVRVLFFGLLKDLSGKSSAVLDLPDGAMVRDVLSHYLSDVPQMRKSMASLAVAVNQEYAGPETVLKSDDEVALLPPVSGGSGKAAGIVRGPVDTRGVVQRLKRAGAGGEGVVEGVGRSQTRGLPIADLDVAAA